MSLELSELNGCAHFCRLTGNLATKDRKKPQKEVHVMFSLLMLLLILYHIRITTAKISCMAHSRIATAAAAYG